MKGDHMKPTKSYFANSCPHCENESIFKGFYSMNQNCPSCGIGFEKEPGYFIGAMIASYFLGVFLAFPTLLAGVFWLDLPILLTLFIATLQLVLLHPLLFRYSRILWIRIEATLTSKVNGSH